ncbi:MAG: S8 family peptidase [Tenacibaculum sp.]
MKFVNSAPYLVVLALSLAACSPISKIPVPVGSDNIINISSKKTPLTNYEQNNWQHLDLATDSLPGMSVKKAYTFLEGKKPSELIVAVIDSGIDLMHEDLKDATWINKNEIPKNGIDDDKNGYIDDVNGWNFLGKSYKEHLEYERILMNPLIADAKTLAEVKAYRQEKIEKAEKELNQYQGIFENTKKAHKILTEYFGKETYTAKQLGDIDTDDDQLTTSIRVAEFIFQFTDSLPDALKELSSIVSKAKKIINRKNLETNYRVVVGDDPYDINSKLGYGDPNTGHTVKDESHGTHVSGIIAASRNNAKGMDGVANRIKIMAVRAVSSGDEYDKDVALGIRYAVDNGARVINTSFGKAFSPNKEWVYQAIKYAAKNDVLIVNAAGNDGKNTDIEKTFPNDAPDLINEIADNFVTVGAISFNYNEKLPAEFSNYGKINVDVFAPGVKIYSTTPENEYKKFSGTSMAAPNTAGVAALIRSYYPKLTAKQVKRILINSGTKIDLRVIKPGSKSEFNPIGVLVPFSDLSASGRIINAYNALKMADKMLNRKK